MSQFDLAAGISQDSLNQLMTQLFTNPIATQKIFKSSVTQNIDGVGDVTLNYLVNAAPTFDLTAPSQDLWNQTVNPTNSPYPTTNAFQFNFSSITVQGENDDAPVTCPLYLFGELITAGDSPYLQVDAVYTDEDSFAGWDKLIIVQLFLPNAIEWANKILNGVTLPALPTLPGLSGVSFQADKCQLVNRQFVVATSQVTSPTTSLDDFVIPADSGIYVMVGSNMLNSLLSSELKGKSFPESGQTGPDAWYAAYNVSVTVQDVSVDISNTPIQLSLTLDDISANGEIGGAGVGVAKIVMCPIGAAIDAISNPGDWDKVIASFDISIKPAPIVVPLTVTLTDNNAQLSLGTLSDINVIAKPNWSGTIGSMLSAASSALADIVPGTLKKTIVNDIIGKSCQNMNVYQLPAISASIAGITITLSAVPGDVAVSNGMLMQQLSATVC